MRRSQWVCIENLRSIVLRPEICSLGQTWTNVWLMWHQKSSMSIKNSILNTLLTDVQSVKHGLPSGWSYIRRSQRVNIERSWSRTNLPEICSEGPYVVFWWYVSHGVLQIWPIGHISGQRVPELELPTHYYWLLLMLPHSFRSPF